MPQPALFVATAVPRFGEADLLRRSTLVDELCCVLQQQDRRFRRFEAHRGSGKVAGENVGLVHPVIGEKAVGRLGRCPVRAGKRDAVA